MSEVCFARKVHAQGFLLVPLHSFEKQETGILVICQVQSEENKSHSGVISGTFTQHEPCSWIETPCLQWAPTMKNKKLNMGSCKKTVEI